MRARSKEEISVFQIWTYLCSAEIIINKCDIFRSFVLVKVTRDVKKYIESSLSQLAKTQEK